MFLPGPASDAGTLAPLNSGVRLGLIMDQLLIKEVEELTSFIRESGEWREIRTLIRKGGFDPDSDLLAAFMEGEEGEEWGVVVDAHGRFFEWFRNTDDYSLQPSWREITNDPDVHNDYPHLEAALFLLRSK